jgi:hypothetical protein
MFAPLEKRKLETAAMIPGRVKAGDEQPSIGA